MALMVGAAIGAAPFVWPSTGNAPGPLPHSICRSLLSPWAGTRRQAMAAAMTRAFSDDSVMVTAWLFQPIIGARDRRAARSALRRRTRRRVRQAARQPGACRYRLRSRHALCGRCRAMPRRVRRQAMPTVENDQKRRGIDRSLGRADQRWCRDETSGRWSQCNPRLPGRFQASVAAVGVTMREDLP